MHLVVETKTMSETVDKVRPLLWLPQSAPTHSFDLTQVGSIVPDNAPVIMGMPDTFFDDDTLIQRIVIETATALLFLVVTE